MRVMAGKQKGSKMPQKVFETIDGIMIKFCTGTNYQSSVRLVTSST
jgi:hypothetical protein